MKEGSFIIRNIMGLKLIAETKQLHEKETEIKKKRKVN